MLTLDWEYFRKVLITLACSLWECLLAPVDYVYFGQGGRHEN
jgi:hypothetical protein